MTDIELTSRAAEAMGYTDTLTAGGKFYCCVPEPPEWAKGKGLSGKGAFVWEPLHDDAQAMALEDYLIERGNLSFNGRSCMWFTPFSVRDSGPGQEFTFADKAGRRRAIVTCIAHLQQAKTAAAKERGEG